MSLDLDKAIGLRSKCPHFRVLIIGRANAGKTTLLKKVCNSIEDPEIFSPDGRKIDPTIVEGSANRGLHDIENQLIFKSNPQFIFHDSRGFESGSVDETEKVKAFIAKRAASGILAKQLHAIWYCLPTDTNRPLLAADEEFFKSGVGSKGHAIFGKVPVIAIFTKLDGLITKAFTQLRTEGLNRKEAKQRQIERAQEMLSNNFIQPLMSTTFRPSDYVQMKDDMRAETSNCSELIEKTANALSDDTLKLLFVSVQQNNIDLCIQYAVSSAWKESDIPSITRMVLAFFPHVWKNTEYDSSSDLTYLPLPSSLVHAAGHDVGSAEPPKRTLFKLRLPVATQSVSIVHVTDRGVQSAQSITGVVPVSSTSSAAHVADHVVRTAQSALPDSRLRSITLTTRTPRRRRSPPLASRPPPNPPSRRLTPRVPVSSTSSVAHVADHRARTAQSALVSADFLPIKNDSCCMQSSQPDSRLRSITLTTRTPRRRRSPPLASRPPPNPPSRRLTPRVPVSSTSSVAHVADHRARTAQSALPDSRLRSITWNNSDNSDDSDDSGDSWNDSDDSDDKPLRDDPFLPAAHACATILAEHYPSPDSLQSDLGRAEIITAICICLEQTFVEASAQAKALPSAFSAALKGYVASTVHDDVNRKIAKLAPQDYATNRVAPKLVKIVTTHRLRIHPKTA